MDKWIHRLPTEVVVNHIIPYTYQCQPKRLLLDIRSFVSDKNVLDAVFFIDYNPNVLIYDLLCYCNRAILPIYNINGCYRDIVRRHVLLKNKTDVQVDNYVFITMYRGMNREVERKIKFIWGLLLPRERTEFLNMYLEND